MEDSKPHAALLASPGMGHIIPMLELGKRLVTLHNFKVTVLTIGSSQDFVSSKDVQLEIVEIPPPVISALMVSDSTVSTMLFVMIREARPAIRSVIASMKHKPTLFIVDLFGTESFGIADDLGIPRYAYITTNAWTFATIVYLPTLHEQVEGEYVDQKEPLKVPGCKPIQPEDVFDPMLSRTTQMYYESLRMGMEITNCNGILLNTWEELEPTTLAALRDDKLLRCVAKVPIYPVGPRVRQVEDSSHQLLDWLEKQPHESVIYVAFGSGGTLSFEQFTELAWGLEMSQQRFIWVARRPTMKSGDGCYLDSENSGDNISSYFPEGFLERTKDVGLVVPNWAPQVQILSHPAVGGFFSHCGWSSTLESVVHGVPMIAWPLHAEQRMNSAMLAEELKIAVRPKVLPAKKIVGREEIDMMVRKIMQDKDGKDIRNRMKALKDSAQKALSEGGSSHMALSQMVKDYGLIMQEKKNSSTE